MKVKNFHGWWLYARWSIRHLKFDDTKALTEKRW